MLKEVIVDITPASNPQPGQPLVTFTKDPVNVANGDLLIWRNNDERNEHWPVPQIGVQADWKQLDVPAKSPGQPAPTSGNATFSGDMTIKYVCAFHPNETGTIIVGKGDTAPTNPLA